MYSLVRYFAMTIMAVQSVFLLACEKKETRLQYSIRINGICITDCTLVNWGIPWDDLFISSAILPSLSWTKTSLQSCNTNGILQDADSAASEFTNGFSIILAESESNYTFRVRDIDDLDGSGLGSNINELGTVGFIPCT